MLKFNFKRLFVQRDVRYPLAYLMKYGCSKHLATKVTTGKFKSLTISQIEKLCMVFNCTPNDLVEYVPVEGEQLGNNPLAVLVRNESLPRMGELLRKIPVEKLPEFNEKFEELAKSLAGGERTEKS